MRSVNVCQAQPTGPSRFRVESSGSNASPPSLYSLAEDRPDMRNGISDDNFSRRHDSPMRQMAGQPGMAALDGCR